MNLVIVGSSQSKDRTLVWVVESKIRMMENNRDKIREKK